MYTRVLNLVDLLASDTQVILRRVLLVGTQVLLETEYHLSISRKTLSGYTGAGEASSSRDTFGSPLCVRASESAKQERSRTAQPVQENLD